MNHATEEVPPVNRAEILVKLKASLAQVEEIYTDLEQTDDIDGFLNATMRDAVSRSVQGLYVAVWNLGWRL